jgi:hypothetical protein
MYVKTFKIKALDYNEEIEISNFTNTTNEIYTTNAELIKESGEYYWLLIVAYNPKNNLNVNHNNVVQNKNAIVSFKEAIKDYSYKNKSNTLRVNNCINYYVNDLLKIKKLEDFHRIPGIGKKSLVEDKFFLLGILDIIKSYQFDN